ncbi:MAG: hypothetical protein A3J79_02840 [Elusimicrobia bacterium RIFOXYB2_FULL_62_6]|nr:MAG: hypothetical protein A3J79_02840 [Elusimicrobia bacterium RIFOXYB2_FULL_62_6]
MKILKMLLLAAAVSVFAGIPSWAAKGPYRFMASTLADSAKSRKKQRVVVAGFYTESGRTSRSCSIVASRLASELAARPNLELIERGKAGAQRAGSNGVLDAAAIKKIGTATGAQAAVTGTVIELGDGKIEVSARLVDAGSGRVLKSITTTIRKDWEKKKSGEFGELNFNEEMDMDALEEMIPDAPDTAGAPEADTCGKLSDEEVALVRQCVELKARKTAFDMKSGALDMHKLTRNPGSEIKDSVLKSHFYSRMNDWYKSDQLVQLTPAEDAILIKNYPMVERYPCR